MSGMTVGELREMLAEHEDDARVILMTQEGYPFENSLVGVCSRRDVLLAEIENGEDCEHEELYFDEDGNELSGEEQRRRRDAYLAKVEEEGLGTDFNGEVKQVSDVFLLEGRQLCYGSKAAWEQQRW